VRTERQSFFPRPPSVQRRADMSAALTDRTTANGVFTQQRSSIFTAVEQLRRPSSQALVLRGSGAQGRWLRGLGAGVAAAASEALTAFVGPPPSERRETQFEETWTELQRYHNEWLSQPRCETNTLQFIRRVNPRAETLAALEEKLRAGSYRQMPGRYPEGPEAVHVPVDPHDPLLNKILRAQEAVAHWLLQVVNETDRAVAASLMDRVSELEEDALLAPDGDSAALLAQMRHDVGHFVCVSPESKAAIVARINLVAPQ
jgi:hypothetical protein